MNSLKSPAGRPADRPIDDRQKHRPAVYAAEARGLLILAVLVLIVALVRYWRFIPWSAR